MQQVHDGGARFAAAHRIASSASRIRTSTESITNIVGAPGSGFATFSLLIPNIAAYLGARFYTQGITLDATANTLGATMSDAALVIIGR